MTGLSAAWSTEVEKELSDARDSLTANNPGRARACARRACGHAIAALGNPGQEQQPGFRGNAVHQLRSLSVDAIVPETVRHAAIRLTTNVRHQDTDSFTNDPIADAMVIVEYIRSELSKRI